MRVAREDSASEVAFLLLDVEHDLEDAVRALGFQSMDGGYRQTYPGNHPDIDRIFRHFSAHIEEMLAQKARLTPIPWADALTALCRTVDGQDIDWWLTGSAALAVRGMAIEPGDLDLVVARESAARFEALLLDTVVEPPRPGWISDTFTRGFLRACIEWIAGVDERAAGQMVGDVGPVAASRLETVTWCGFPIRVPPLDLQLAVNVARGLDEHATWIRSAMTRAASR